MTATEAIALAASLLTLRIGSEPSSKPIHHAYLHPITMARLRLSCNHPATLTVPASSSATATTPCLLHIWPDTSTPLDACQLHAAAASTFSLPAASAVHLTPANSDSSLASLPAAIQLNILRWLQPVTTQSKLPASASPSSAQSSDAALEAAISRQLWGRQLVAHSFTLVSVLSQPQLMYVDTISPAPSHSASSAAALVTPTTACHYAVTAASPASLVQPSTSASASVWADHVVATFPKECMALRHFLALHTHSLHSSAAASTSSPPALLICGGGGTAKSALLSTVGSSVSGSDIRETGSAAMFVRRLHCGDIIASSGASGEESNLLKEAWQRCQQHMRQTRQAAVLLLDDVTPLLTTSNFPSLSSQLLALLDTASPTHTSPLLVAACDDTQPIAQHWLRAGRFDEQLHMRAPSVAQRQRVLEWCVAGSGLTATSELVQRVAGRMHGCTVRQLVQVWRHATLLWAEGNMDTESGKEVSWQQLETAIQSVAPPSSTASLLLSSPATTTSSVQPTAADPFPLVGGYSALKKHLLLLLHSFLRPHHTQGAKRTIAASARPSGILLHGVSGCGKSMLLSSLAALVTASPGVLGGALFGVVRLHVASVLSPYLGESERRLRSVFEQAKANAPCLLLVDDIDALAGSRGGGDGAEGGDEEGGATRLLTTLLVLLDGVDSPATPPVLLVATAASPAALDSALLRPGRLSNQLHVGLPTADDRRLIVQRVAEMDGVWLSDAEKGGVEWEEVVRRTQGCSGAELCGLVRQSVWTAWREGQNEKRPSQRLEMRHFRQAMQAMGCLD